VCVCAHAPTCVKNWAIFCSVYLKEQDYLEELDIAESIVLKWIFKKYEEQSKSSQKCGIAL